MRRPLQAILFDLDGTLLDTAPDMIAALNRLRLEELDLCERFACVVSGDSLPLRKPHPLPMLHAAKLAGVAADACVYLGDAERDVQAAHAARMEALVATYGYLHTGEDWQAWGGDGFLERPLDLIAWLEGSRRA